MSNMDLYEKSLSYHVKGPSALREGTDLKHDKNHNGIDDKDEKQPKDNVVKKTNAMAEESIYESDSYSSMQDAKKHAAKNGENYSRDVSVQHRYDSYHMKKRGYTHFTTGGYGTRTYHKGSAGHDSTKIGPEHHRGVKESAEDIVDSLQQALIMAEMNEKLLEDMGIDLTELFSELEEGFQNMSKTKRLIARRRAGRSKKLTQGYHQSNNSKAAKKPTSIQK